MSSASSTMTPKNWAKFQHYKDRSPPWIKLHREILDDFDYACLPLASKALAPLLWLLSAEDMQGSITAEPARLAHRLRWSIDDVVAGLKPLLDKGFFVLDSGVLAECLQLAIPETEAETYKPEREKALVQPLAAQSRFNEFWSVYPNKKSRQEAEKSWRKQKLDARADDLIAHVRLMSATDSDWKRGYAPMGSTYLNQARWEDIPKRPPSGAPPAAPSKTLSAIHRLEAMKNGLDDARDHDGFPETALLGAGAHAGH